jgi:carbon-monoxide dehydrogenase small subunit
MVTLSINGKTFNVDVDDNTPLLWAIREQVGLTGTKYGCGIAQCGACTVHVDGKSLKSCTMLAAEAEGHEITTIEGMAQGGELHPMQAAFKEHHGLQCGFCTPGMIMSATDLCSRTTDPSEHEVRHWLEGNLCRCTGYHNIVKAVRAGAAGMRGGK